MLLCGMEEGLFPHSRTLTDPTGLEEERRLCYVGMTRAMDTLVLSRARYRRRYGNDMPDAALPLALSRRSADAPAGGPERRSRARDHLGLAMLASYSGGSSRFGEQPQQRALSAKTAIATTATRTKTRARVRRRLLVTAAVTELRSGGKRGDAGSIDNIASFFANRGRRQCEAAPAARAGANRGHGVQERTARPAPEVWRWRGLPP